MTLADALTDHPARSTFDQPQLLEAMRACQECALACTLCADSDLARDAVEMHGCIRTCVDAATIATATAAVLARPTPTGRAWEDQVRACVTACRECAEECEQHDHACCRTCAEACRSCEQALERLLAVAD